MKKTLIAILALGSVAVGAEQQPWNLDLENTLPQVTTSDTIDALAVETLTAVTVNDAWAYRDIAGLIAGESLKEGSYTLGSTMDINISDALWQTIVNGVGEGNQFNVTIYDVAGNQLVGFENVTFNMKGQSVTMQTDSYIGHFTAIVPEPTTATLSLLALAGLAARRRRK